MRAFLLLLMLLLGAGCSTQNGARWYAPSTWLSGKPGADVDRTAAVEDTARRAVIKQAQKATHETSVALASAPASRPVAVATSTNATAVALLDQSAGPLDAGELARLRATVTGLLSENAQTRAEAEKQWAREQETISNISAALAKAEGKSHAAEERLRAAFERENALANELRSQRALVWIAASIAVVGLAGWLYVKIALGGMPTAIGMAMRKLRTEQPELAAKVKPFYTQYLNRREQIAIERHAQKTP